MKQYLELKKLVGNVLIPLEGDGQWIFGQKIRLAAKQMEKKVS